LTTKNAFNIIFIRYISKRVIINVGAPYPGDADNQAMTGYESKKPCKTAPPFRSNVSDGSLYPALNRCEASGSGRGQGAGGKRPFQKNL
jgi:hypothetical protein